MTYIIITTQCISCIATVCSNVQSVVGEVVVDREEVVLCILIVAIKLKQPPLAGVMGKTPLCSHGEDQGLVGCLEAREGVDHYQVFLLDVYTYGRRCV